MGRSLELDDYYDLATPTELSLAPDGDRVAFVVDEFDPDEDERRRSLFVAPTDGSRDPHRLTRASDAGQPTWGPAGDRLAFVAAREEDVSRKIGRDEEDEETETGDDDEPDEENGGPPGEEGPKPQVWVYDLALGGDARQVTDFDEGVRQFDWGPEGERIVAAARDPTDDEQEYVEQVRDDGPIEVERLQHKANGVGFLDEVTTYLFVVDVESGESTRLDDAYGQGAREPIMGLQPAWGPGDRIAFASNRTENPDDSEIVDCYTIDPDGEDLRKITDSDLRATMYRWAPDGERLAFVGGDGTNWYKPSEVYVTPDEADADYHSVSASLDRTITFSGEPRWLDDETLLTAIGDDGHSRLVRLDPAEDAPERVLDAQGRGRSLTWAGFDAAGDTVAVALSDPGRGIDLFAVDRDDLDADGGDVFTRLSALNDDLLSEVTLPEARRVTYENDDGVEVEAIVYVPENFEEDDDPRPVVTSIHGGPMAYDDPEFRFDYAYWTGQDYVVMCPNYRGSTSYGREFAESLKGTRGDLETDDVVSGLHELADRGWVDPDRSLVTGFSYGGITTANVVVREDAFTAAAAEHGIYDFRSTFGTDDNHLWHEWEFGLPWENEDLYDEISSINMVDNVETPLLVTAGENDWRCPPTQAEQLYVSVKKQGVPAKLVIYQNEHHNVGDPDRAQHRLETLTDWLRRHDPETDLDEA